MFVRTVPAFPNHRIVSAAIAALLAVSAPLGPALAQGSASDPAAQALIERLRPSAGGVTRGLPGPGDATVARPWPVPSPTPAGGPFARPAHAAPVPRAAAAARPHPTAAETMSEAPSVSITITFPPGSAALTPEAERALAPLGRALASADLAPYRFRIEGHTDTVGDAALNQHLSERRAAAVREHLARTYAVAAARLIPVGFGSAQLLIETPPQTPEERNRRVQVVNLGD